MAAYTYNILSFSHPEKQLVLHFYDKDAPGLMRLYKTTVPDEVLKHFGEQDHYYTSFSNSFDNSFQVTKLTTPSKEKALTKSGEEKIFDVRNSAFTSSILKRYYAGKIHLFFTSKNILVKPNFIDDIEIWLPLKESDSLYNYYEKYTLKIQFCVVTKGPELCVIFDGKSKVFKESVASLLEDVSPDEINWVIHENNLYKFENLPSEAREHSYPVWNFGIRDALGQPTGAPERGNKYKKFKEKISFLYNTYLNTNEFKAIIPLSNSDFLKVNESKIGSVQQSSNRLLFGKVNGERKSDIVPYNGMKNGPYESSPTTKIHFFYIYSEQDKELARKIDNYFRGTVSGFKGLLSFIHTPYHTEKGFSIVFKDRLNPLPEVLSAIEEKHFDDSIQYIAIYISPLSKHKISKVRRGDYYKIKEALLKRKVTSQALDAEKINSASNYHFSLPNIAIAILAKLNGTPWMLDTKPKNELVVGVGAFKDRATETQYIGSAFSFSNNGKFNRFECFLKNQTDELAGSIISTVKEYAAVNSDMKKLVIHFYKTMSKKELKPIEDGLRELDIDVPIFIISINKTESNDIIAFDEEWKELMPQSGTFINIGFNKFLLFNNTKYSEATFKDSDGYPFPIKVKIFCTDRTLADDYKSIKELLDQLYQFSRMYWKSVRQQNLPVTIKYPEMVAEMVPHFDGHAIPDYGKDNLWFL